MNCTSTRLKLNTLKREHLEWMRDACVELLHNYTHPEIDSQLNCVLCDFADRMEEAVAFNAPTGKCYQCPWLCIEGTFGCTDWWRRARQPEYDGISIWEARVDRLPKLVTLRIPMLKRWIDEIERSLSR